MCIHVKYSYIVFMNLRMMVSQCLTMLLLLFPRSRYCQIYGQVYSDCLYLRSLRTSHNWIQGCPSRQRGWLCDTLPLLVDIQASRCAGRVHRFLAVKNLGVSLRHSYENGGRVVPPGTVAVLLQDIPGEKGSLPIRYPDLVRPMYWVSLVGI